MEAIRLALELEGVSLVFRGDMPLGIHVVEPERSMPS